jgi:hypothetical protein
VECDGATGTEQLIRESGEEMGVMGRLLGSGEKGWDEFAGGRVGSFLRLCLGRGLAPVALRRRAAKTLEKVRRE